MAAGDLLDFLDRPRGAHHRQHLVRPHAIEAAEIVPHLPQLPPELLAAAEPGIEAIRPRLLPLFRALPAADLATAGIFFTARKPG